MATWNGVQQDVVTARRGCSASSCTSRVRGAAVRGARHAPRADERRQAAVPRQVYTVARCDLAGARVSDDDGIACVYVPEILFIRPFLYNIVVPCS
jgi:hypothetical protein